MKRILLLPFLFFTLCFAFSSMAEATVSEPAPVVATNNQPSEEDLTSLPTGKGLPVVVQVGLFFQSITALNDSDGNFEGTIDLRLRWGDPRLRYPAEQTINGFKEYRDAKAATKMAQIWVPSVELTNQLDTPSYQSSSLRIFPDGVVEVMRRVKSKFTTSFETASFPFDVQNLAINVGLRHENTDQVGLVFLQEDRDYSGAAPNLAIDGWTPGAVATRQVKEAGWYGESLSGLHIGLNVARDAGSVVGPIFIPLFASLLIPLLTIWMNRTENGKFMVESLDIANVLVGGLFAVIALNLTINSMFKAVAEGDNMLSRLFGLNYVMLGLAMAIIVLIYRLHIPKRLFGWYVEEQLFAVLMWAVPLLAFGIWLAFVLMAAA